MNFEVRVLKTCSYVKGMQLLLQTTTLPSFIAGLIMMSTFDVRLWMASNSLRERLLIGVMGYYKGEISLVMYEAHCRTKMKIK